MSEKQESPKHFLLEDLPLPDHTGIVLICIFMAILAMFYAISNIECAKIISQTERGGVKVAKILREHRHIYEHALASGKMVDISRAEERLAHCLADFYRAGMISGWYIEVCLSESNDARYSHPAYIPKRVLAQYEPDFRWVVKAPI